MAVTLRWRVGIIVAVFTMAVAISQFTSGDNLVTYCMNYSTYGHCDMRVEKVSSKATRERGLSGRKTITKNTGMLFVFEQPGVQCIWMKDMKFPIDIVWLNSTGLVIKVEANVSPDSFPKSFCQSDALYVLETAAGASNLPWILLGMTVKI